MSEETRNEQTQPTQDASNVTPEQLAEAIRENLRQVVDPEIGLDLVTLGLIKHIVVEDNRVEMHMLLTTPFCPYAPWLVQQAKEKIAQVVPDREVHVEVLPEPWDPSMMEDPGLLGFGPGMEW